MRNLFVLAALIFSLFPLTAKGLTPAGYSTTSFVPTTPPSSSAAYSSGVSGKHPIPSSTGTFYFIQDISCPKQPAISKSTGCKPVCPTGYKPSADRTSALISSTGVYVCIKEDASSSTGSYSSSYTTTFGSSTSSSSSGSLSIPVFKGCEYVNPYCENEVMSSQREATKKMVAEVTENYMTLPSATDSTYIKNLLKIATFDPEYAREVEAKSSSALYLFFVDSFKVFASESDKLALLYYLFFAIWFGGYFSASKFLEGSAQGFKLSAIRALFGFVFFVVPIPQKISSTDIVYQPAIVKAISKSVYAGNDLADKLAVKLNGVFISHMITLDTNHSNNLSMSLREKLRNDLKDINRNEKQVSFCLRLYDGDLLVPDDMLENVNYIGTEAILRQIEAEGMEPDLFSKVSCRSYLQRYKSAVKRYNALVAFLNTELGASHSVSVTKTEIEKILKNPKDFTPAETTDKKKQLLQQIKYTALWQRKLGWISYPLITLPVMKFNEATMDVEDKIVLKDTMDANVFSKAIGVLSFPPGSMIFKFSNEALRGIVKFLAALPFFSRLGKLLGLLAGTGTELAAGAATIAALGLSYWFTMTILKLFPIIILMVAVSFKIVGYVLDVFKLTVMSPFIAVHAVSVKRYDNLYKFTARVFALMVEPLILLVASFIGFFGVRIAEYMLYTIPINALEAMKDMGVGVNFFMMFVLEGVFFYISVIGSSVLAYKIIMSSTETFFRYFGLEQSGVSQQVTRFTEDISRKIGSPI